MKSTLKFLFIIVLISVSCSKNDNPVNKNNGEKVYPVTFNLSGFPQKNTAKQIFLWIYKDDKFFDTTTIDSADITKGSFTKKFPAGDYKVTGVGKDANFLFTDTIVNASPTYNIYLPKNGFGELDSTRIEPNLNFVIEYVTHDSASQAFYDYFICDETEFSVQSTENKTDLNFNRLGGQLSIIIDDIDKYPNSLVQFSVGAEAVEYDFLKKNVVSSNLGIYQDNHWPGLFNTSNGRSTIIQNLTGDSFQVYFFVKKNKDDGVYYLHYIYDVPVYKNKRTILEGNLFDGDNTEQTFKTRIVDDWDSNPQESGYY